MVENAVQQNGMLKRPPLLEQAHQRRIADVLVQQSGRTRQYGLEWGEGQQRGGNEGRSQVYVCCAKGASRRRSELMRFQIARSDATG